MLRTQVRIRIGNSPEIKTVDVMASCKIAGYQFLIHRADRDNSKYTVTYAPVGLSGGGSYDTIEDTIASLAAYIDRLPAAIDSALESMRAQHMPLLAPEAGIQVEMQWSEREQYRFNCGEYLPVPRVLGLEYPQEHYLHLSNVKTETDFIAYTPSPEYGERDRQTRMKFGKYLRKTFPELTDQQIQKGVMDLRTVLALADSPAKLLFATDRETINQIFETAMCACDSTYTSCMHGKFDGDSVRPYHVYADSPDVAVAYVLEHGEIVARSVVSTKDMEWVRAYAVGGCSTKRGILCDLLARAGYEKGDLVGNRLTKLKTRKVMLPYIDNAGAQVSDCGGYWQVVSRGGDYEANQTDGTASSSTPCFNSCDCPEDECECSYCECCEERYRDGCDTCSMCEVCDRCTEHGACRCARCSECHELIEEHRHISSCACERCSECGELDSECDCEKCTKCGQLEVNCECEEDEETEGENEANQSSNTPRDVAIPASSSV